VSQRDGWKADIVTACIGLGIGLVASLKIPRASVGSFEVAKAALVLLVVFVALHYVRRFFQAIPIIEEVVGPLSYGLQLFTACTLGAGLAINYLPG